MNTIKGWLKYLLRKGLTISPAKEPVEQFTQEIAGLREEVKLYGIAPWYQENLWEPPVQIALRDLCQSGDIVFDVGANFGGLTTVMSRRVGPKGVVCAFEASPRIVDKCQRNLVLSGCNNVQLYHAAVYHQSFVKVPIYLGGHLNDSIYANKPDDLAAYQVSTVALDDFVQQTRLVPNLVKMDIEGAEFDAVRGMLRTIATAKPHLILETQREDTRCLELLREKGYMAIDLNSYREIKSADDYPPGATIRNNLYIHHDRLSEVPYEPPLTFIKVAVLTEQDFVNNTQGSVSCQNPIKLSPGRYLIDVDFSAQGTDNEMMCGVKIGEKVIFRYHAYTSFLAQSYRDWVINLAEISEIKLYFDFMNNTYDRTFSVEGAKISRIGEFDNLSPVLDI